MQGYPKIQSLISPVTAVFILTSLGFFQDHLWIGAVAIQFEFYTTVFLFFYMLYGFTKKNQQQLFFKVMMFVLHVYYVYAVHKHLPWKEAVPVTEASYSLLSWNKRIDNNRNEQAANFLDSSKVDMEGVLEVNKDFLGLLQPEFQTISHPEDGYFGIALRKKTEFDTVIEHQMLDGKITFYRTDIILDGSPIHYYIVHLLPPLKPWEYQDFLRGFEEFKNILLADLGNKIVTGDFNTTIYLNQFQYLLHSNQLQKLGNRYWHPPTWGFGIPMLELDHVLVSKNLDMDMELVYQFIKGSDHQALLTRIGKKK